mmetsp:Transcript_91999/g.265436  ORF Transcript_91999/g.265436 Transcript_91999/m.265436 type:complete len:342 (+) Transcript_91999:1994-3019(+)
MGPVPSTLTVSTTGGLAENDTARLSSSAAFSCTSFSSVSSCTKGVAMRPRTLRDPVEGTSSMSAASANCTPFTVKSFSALAATSASSAETKGVGMRLRGQRMSGASALKRISWTNVGSSRIRACGFPRGASWVPTSRSGRTSTGIPGIPTLARLPRVDDRLPSSALSPEACCDPPLKARSSDIIVDNVLRKATSSLDSSLEMLLSCRGCSLSSSEESFFCTAATLWLHTQQAKRSRESMDICNCLTVLRNLSFSGSAVGVSYRACKSASNRWISCSITRFSARQRSRSSRISTSNCVAAMFPVASGEVVSSTKADRTSRSALRNSPTSKLLLRRWCSICNT